MSGAYSFKIDREFLQGALAGTTPKLGDEKPPWTYRGWLAWYVQMIQAQSDGVRAFLEENPIPDDAEERLSKNEKKEKAEHVAAVRDMARIVNRWGYWLEAYHGDGSPVRPIPQIQFSDCADSGAMSMYRKCIEKVEYHVGWCGGFREFVGWMLFGLGMTDEQPKIRAEDQEWLYRNFNVQKILAYPADYLGMLLSERKGRDNPTAFFPTSHSVCECMAQINFGDQDPHLFGGPEDPRMQTVCDPCLGTGRMLLHASNFAFSLYGMDIELAVIQIALVNGALYAPWMVAPAPWTDGRVIRQGDSLRVLMVEPDAPWPETEEEFRRDLLGVVANVAGSVEEMKTEAPATKGQLSLFPLAQILKKQRRR